MTPECRQPPEPRTDAADDRTSARQWRADRPGAQPDHGEAKTAIAHATRAPATAWRAAKTRSFRAGLSDRYAETVPRRDAVRTRGISRDGAPRLRARHPRVFRRSNPRGI